MRKGKRGADLFLQDHSCSCINDDLNQEKNWRLEGQSESCRVALGNKIEMRGTNCEKLTVFSVKLPTL